MTHSIFFFFKTFFTGDSGVYTPDTPATLGSTLHKTILWIFSCISPWSTLDLLCFILLFTMKPTYGLQALHMDKSFKYNSMQTLVHRDCHQLPKPHMGASMLFQSPPFW
jgi:Trk-type K+ transport system membrane component